MQYGASSAEAVIANGHVNIKIPSPRLVNGIESWLKEICRRINRFIPKSTSTYMISRPEAASLRCSAETIPATFTRSGWLQTYGRLQRCQTDEQNTQQPPTFAMFSRLHTPRLCRYVSQILHCLSVVRSSRVSGQPPLPHHTLRSRRTTLPLHRGQLSNLKLSGT